MWPDHGLVLLCCFSTRTACHHWWNYTCWSILANSGYTVCLWTWRSREVHLTVRQRSKTHKFCDQRMIKAEKNVLECPRPDYNPIKMWNGLKWTLDAQKPTNIRTLNLFYREEWTKTPPSQCIWLISSYKKHLVVVIAVEEDHTSYWIQRFIYFVTYRFVAMIYLPQ